MAGGPGIEATGIVTVVARLLFVVTVAINARRSGLVAPIVIGISDSTLLPPSAVVLVESPVTGYCIGATAVGGDCGDCSVG